MGGAAHKTSIVLIEELFDREDPRFFAEICGAREPSKPGLGRQPPSKLGAFGDRWARDPRPWARQMLLRWIDETRGARPGQRALTKHVLKACTAAADHEVLAHFVVAFDALIEVELVRDWRSQMVLRAPRRPRPSRRADEVVFTNRTRRFLQRYAVRPFRALGERDPETFRRWVFYALARYTDEQLSTPARLITSRGLLVLLHHGCREVVWIAPRATGVVPGRTLAELRPEPLHAAAWRSIDDLVDLLLSARSLYVRRQVAAFARREMASELEGLPFFRVRALLASPYIDVAQFGASLFANAKGIEALSLAEWSDLVSIDDPEVIATLATAIRAHVTPARADLAHCVRWATSSAAPIAEIGLAWAKEKRVEDAASLAIALPMLHAPIAAVRTAAIDWLAPLVIALAEPIAVRDLLDSRHDDTRARALEIVLASARLRDETMLWAALAESPYPDTRERLIAHLEVRAAALTPESVRHVWATTLLAVHRGSRAKRRALEQIATRAIAMPEEIDALLPLLAIALRSVREPERRAAIAALCRAALGSPSIAGSIARGLPELSISTEAGAR